MNNIYIALITGLLYFCIKFLETRIIKKEQPVFKLLFRDTLLVSITSVIAYFVYGQFSILIEDKQIAPQVFVNEPDF